MKKLAMFLAVLSVSACAATCTGAQLTPDTRITDASSQAEQAGDSARLRQDFASSAAYYQKALRLDPTNSMLYNKLGIVEFKLDNERAARKSFNLALKYDPRDDQALNNLGAMELVQRRYKAAMRYLKQALALNESDASAHVNMAEAWMGMGQVDRAMTEYSRALELDGDILSSSDTGVVAQLRTPEQEARIDFLIAKAYAQRGNLDGALDYLGRAKDRLYPNLSEVYSDQEFAALWNDPRLKKIVKK